MTISILNTKPTMDEIKMCDMRYHVLYQISSMNDSHGQVVFRLNDKLVVDLTDLTYCYDVNSDLLVKALPKGATLTLTQDSIYGR